MKIFINYFCKLYSIFIFFSFLSACAPGLYGTVACGYQQGDGFQEMTVTGLGLSISNASADGGGVIGWTKRTYLFTQPEQPIPTFRSFAFCPFPTGDLLVSDIRIFGMEVDLNMAEAGISVGYSSLVLRKPIKPQQSLSLSYTYVRGKIEETQLSYCAGDACGGLPQSLLWQGVETALPTISTKHPLELPRQ